MITKEQLYMCFDSDLKWYLLDNGCHYLFVAASAKSRDKFWLFENNEMTKYLICKYKKQKYQD